MQIDNLHADKKYKFETFCENNIGISPKIVKIIKTKEEIPEELIIYNATETTITIELKINEKR